MFFESSRELFNSEVMQNCNLEIKLFQKIIFFLTWISSRVAHEFPIDGSTLDVEPIFRV